MNHHLKFAFGAAALLLAAQASAQITFYEGEGFSGRRLTTDQRIGNLRRDGFDNGASSVVVERGHWEVCEDRRFEGRCVVLRRGSYESLRSLGMNNGVASVRPLERERYRSEEMPPPPPVSTYERRPREPEYLAAPEPRPAPAPVPAPAPRFERMTLAAKELFNFDSAALRLPQPKIDRVASLLNRFPEITTLHISGYTDRLGSDQYNLKLSQRRADAVKAYLVAKGIAANRLVAQGKGESDPVVECSQSNRTELIECLEPNRRIEIEQITVERRARQ